MKLVVHVGLHRAASTAVQHWLSRQRGELAARRTFLHVGLASGEANSPFGILLAGHLKAMGGEPAAAFLIAELERLAGHHGAGIISDENLLGPMPGPRAKAFANVEELCRVLDRLGAAHEIIPVIVLRQHADWIASLHRHHQSYGGTLDAATFARAMGAAALRFAPLLQTLASARRLIVDSVEQIAADGGHRLLTRLGAALGLATEVGERLPIANASPAPLHLAITARLGARHAMLARQGGPAMAGLVAAATAGGAEAAEALAHHVRTYAVHVNWAQTPARRMHRVNVLFGSAVPEGQRLSLDACRTVVAEALAMPGRPGPMAELPLDAFAADRQTVAQAYLPEWSNPT